MHGVGLHYWFSWFGGTVPGHYSVLTPYVLKIVPPGLLSNPRGLAIRGQRLIVADDKHHRIAVFDTGGRFLSTFAQGPGNGYGIQTTYNGGVTGLVLSNSFVTEWGAGTYFNPTTGFTATGNSFTGNGNDILGDGWVAGSFIDNNSFANSVGSHIGYGTYLSVEDMRKSARSPAMPVSTTATPTPRPVRADAVACRR